jgi:hypothetical protein
MHLWICQQLTQTLDSKWWTKTGRHVNGQYVNGLEQNNTYVMTDIITGEGSLHCRKLKEGVILIIAREDVTLTIGSQGEGPLLS